MQYGCAKTHFHRANPTWHHQLQHVLKLLPKKIINPSWVFSLMRGSQLRSRIDRWLAEKVLDLGKTPQTLFETASLRSVSFQDKATGNVPFLSPGGTCPRWDWRCPLSLRQCSRGQRGTRCQQRCLSTRVHFVVWRNQTTSRKWSKMAGHDTELPQGWSLCGTGIFGSANVKTAMVQMWTVKKYDQ